jgi:hypothetical protein
MMYHLVPTIKSYVPGVDSKSIHPYKIEVFEDWVYMSSYLTHDIFKVDKRGKGALLPVETNLKRPSDVVMAQEQKQRVDGGDPCAANPCHASAICLLAVGGRNVTCSCPDHLKPIRSRAKGAQVIRVLYCGSPGPF